MDNTYENQFEHNNLDAIEYLRATQFELKQQVDQLSASVNQLSTSVNQLSTAAIARDSSVTAAIN